MLFQPRLPATGRRAAAPFGDDHGVAPGGRGRIYVPQPRAQDPLAFSISIDRGRVEGLDPKVPGFGQELERLRRLVQA